MSQRHNRTVEEEEIDSNLEDAIKECVRFIVSREGSKIPIKRADIQHHLKSHFQTPDNTINIVLKEANKALGKVYGMKLVKVDCKGGHQYIAVLSKDCEESISSTATDDFQRKLFIAALMHVYMSGGTVKDDDMWKFLEEAGLLEENDLTTKKILIKTFTRQLYLTYSKVGEGDMARNIFEWGQRATEEIPKMFLLNKMAEAFDKTPDFWCEQHKEAIAESGEPMEAS